VIDSFGIRDRHRCLAPGTLRTNFTSARTLVSTAALSRRPPRSLSTQMCDSLHAHAILCSVPSVSFLSLDDLKANESVFGEPRCKFAI